MHVRLLTEADADAYRLLRLASIDESPMLSSPEIVRELAILARIESGVLSGHRMPNSRVWGAFDEGRLAGVVAATCGVWHDCRDKVHLWGLYVWPAYRGGDASPSLVRAVLGWSRRQRDVRVITLHVDKRNQRALRWFHHAGFQRMADDSLRVTRLRAMRFDLDSASKPACENSRACAAPGCRLGRRPEQGDSAPVACRRH